VSRLLGNRQMRAEQAWTYQGGYRAQLHRKFSLDAAGFLTRYDRLVTLEPKTPFFEPNPPPPHLVLPIRWDNGGYGRTYGGEFFAYWQVTGRWRLSPGYSLLQQTAGLKPFSQDVFATRYSGDAPKHQAQIRSTLNLPHHLEWDASAYYVGALPNGPVPSYTRVDTRLGWRIGESLELSIAGQNLLSPRRMEIVNPFITHSTQVQRSVVAKATWRF
jgi:iron complex outermembrane receptor protein